MAQSKNVPFLLNITATLDDSSVVTALDAIKKSANIEIKFTDESIKKAKAAFQSLTTDLSPLKDFTQELEKQTTAIQKAVAALNKNKGKNGGSTSTNNTVYTQEDSAQFEKQILGMQGKLIGLNKTNKNLGDEFTQELDNIKDDVKDLENHFVNFKSVSKDSVELVKNEIIALNNEMKKEANTEGHSIGGTEQTKQTQKYSDLLKDINSLQNLNTKSLHDQYADEISYLETRTQAAAKNVEQGKDQQKQYGELAKETTELNTKIHQSLTDVQKESTSTLGTIRRKAKEFIGYLLTNVAFHKITQSIKTVISYISELDKSLTQVQVVTGYTGATTKQLTQDYIALAQEMGVTVSDVADATLEYVRQGNSMETSLTLARESIKLAKLSSMDFSSATTYLTATMKSFKIEASDVATIVDKLVAVDNSAATSAAELAEALSKTAVSASMAGLSLDEALGYIATISETTRMGAEEVGTGLRQMFARMETIKLGAIDEAGAGLNDVERSLKLVGVALRNSTGNFRDMSDVLDEVAGQWDNMTSTQQNAIAVALGGTRQREKMLVLLENYDRALELTEESADSTGRAEERYGFYISSVEGKQNQLKASTEELYTTLVGGDSSLYKAFLSIANGAIKITNLLGGWTALIPALMSLIVLWKPKVFEPMFTLLQKTNLEFKLGKISVKEYALANNMSMEEAKIKIKELSMSYDTLKASVKAAMKTMLLTAIITGVIALISALVEKWKEWNNEWSILSDKINETKSSLESINSIIKSYEDKPNLSTDELVDYNSQLVERIRLEKELRDESREQLSAATFDIEDKIVNQYGVTDTQEYADKLAAKKEELYAKYGLTKEDFDEWGNILSNPFTNAKENIEEELRQWEIEINNKPTKKTLTAQSSKTGEGIVLDVAQYDTIKENVEKAIAEGNVDLAKSLNEDASNILINAKAFMEQKTTFLKGLGDSLTDEEKQAEWEKLFLAAYDQETFDSYETQYNKYVEILAKVAADSKSASAREPLVDQIAAARDYIETYSEVYQQLLAEGKLTEEQVRKIAEATEEGGAWTALQEFLSIDEKTGEAKINISEVMDLATSKVEELRNAVKLEQADINTAISQVLNKINAATGATYTTSKLISKIQDNTIAALSSFSTEVASLVAQFVGLNTQLTIVGEQSKYIDTLFPETTDAQSALKTKYDSLIKLASEYIDDYYDKLTKANKKAKKEYEDDELASIDKIKAGLSATGLTASDKFTSILSNKELNGTDTIDSLQKELDLIEEQKDEEDAKLKLQEAQLEVTQKQIQLEQLKNARTVRVYKKGVGWTFIQDASAIADAEADLEDAKQSLADLEYDQMIDAKKAVIEALEDERDKIVKYYEDSNDALEEQKDTLLDCLEIATDYSALWKELGISQEKFLSMDLADKAKALGALITSYQTRLSNIIKASENGGGDDDNGDNDVFVADAVVDDITNVKKTLAIADTIMSKATTSSEQNRARVLNRIASNELKYARSGAFVGDITNVKKTLAIADTIMSKATTSSEQTRARALNRIASNELKDLLGYARGGVVDYTGTAELHGSPLNKEVVLNGAQSANILYQLANQDLGNKTSTSTDNSMAVNTVVVNAPNNATFDKILKTARNKLAVTR